MVTTRRHGVWWSALWCALCAVGLMVTPLLGTTALGDNPVNTVAYAGQPSVQAVEPIDYKPKLFKMLAYNKRIDTGKDELRMDFVLRVAHGQVNVDDPTSCASGVPTAGRSCGLQLKYDFYARSTGTATSIQYINTLSGGIGTALGAGLWAMNRSQRYTIHSVLHSGVYDYLTISIECDIDYPDTVDPSVLGGVVTPQYVYAQVKPVGGSWQNASDRTDSQYLTNLTADYPAYLYDNACSGNNCNGPRSFVGYDVNPPLWGGGQINWGLVSDNGLSTGPPLNLNFGDGYAPPKAFFVYWYNPSTSAPCSKVESYYFQWLGLKNGKDWEPVSDLTPSAQLVTGQDAQNGSPIGATNVNAFAAYNAPSTYPLRPKLTLIAQQGPSNGLSPAQSLTGAINFQKAKDDQDLDGYFKLVTWPITTNQNNTNSGCLDSDNKDVYNPLADNSNGIQADMSQADINALIDKGWTIDTAYYKYKLPVIDPPAITSPTNNSYSSTTHPTIGGTGIEGYTVQLYAEDPDNPISGSDPDNPDTRGRYVGQAVVGPGGTWTIVDNDNTMTNGEVQYHAWQIEPDSGYQITSGFSNIQTVKFAVDPAPVVDAVVTVPHTKRTLDGQLQANAKVHITGTAVPVIAGSTLKVYATHATSDNVAAVAATPPDESDAIDECEQVLTAAGSQSWSCDVDPSYFLDQTAEGETYLFRAKLINASGSESAISSGTTVVPVDMTSTQIAISNTSDYQTLRGTAYSLPSTIVSDTGATITVKWPDNSTGTTTVASDGTWSIAVPSGMTTSGVVQVTADDLQTNEAGWVSRFLNVSVPATALPLTGDHSWLPWLIGEIVLALMAIGACIYMYVERSTRYGKAVDVP